jgi:hypothetical protein
MTAARLASLLLAVLLPATAPAAGLRWVPLPADAGSTGSLAAPKLQVGVLRPVPKDQPAFAWEAEGGTAVGRFDVASADAFGLRTRLVLDGTGPLTLNVRGADGRVESMAIPAGAQEAWGPWTPGDAQALEVRSEGGGLGTVRVGGIVHFDRPLAAKAAGSCTVDAVCATGNPVLDAAIAARKKSMAQITFVEGSRAFVCTGTLVESERAGESFFLTANHCIGTQAVASTLSSRWFYENTACGSGPVNPASVQTSGGMDVVFADPNTDMTLLRLRAAPPAGVTYARLDGTKLATGEAVTSLSHPDGDVAKWAQASISGELRFKDWPQAAWLTTFSRGIIQGGSSGSGLFTLAPDGTLALRAVLSATTLDSSGSGLSCTNNDQFGVYNRLDVFLPEARGYLSAAGPVPDDHGNRPAEATPVALGASPVIVNGRIDTLGDVDVFRIPVAQQGVLIVRASGGVDTVGLLLDREGAGIEHNDDAQVSSLDFGLTSSVTPGTYYLAVSHWESAGTGAYQLSFELQPIGDNHTDLWWNASESGWGMNINQQSNIVFATLFTYGADGSPLWLVMSAGLPQPDGRFSGALYRAAGPPFGANPWSPSAVSLAPVGTMAIAFTGAETATLDYTVDGIAVSKAITRQRFSTNTTCKWSVFDRSYAFNYQDLWWNPAESGWGINFTQQGSVLFATLFDYDEQGRNAWYAMTNGARVSGGTDSWTGALYRFTGPRFDTQPWTPVSPRQVGTMTVDFTAGNKATLSYTINGIAVTKSVERQVFAPLRPECKSANAN